MPPFLEHILVNIDGIQVNLLKLLQLHYLVQLRILRRVQLLLERLKRPVQILVLQLLLEVRLRYVINLDIVFIQGLLQAVHCQLERPDLALEHCIRLLERAHLSLQLEQLLLKGLRFVFLLA